MERGLSNRFLNAMRSKLKKGRRRGYCGWDERWEEVEFAIDPLQFMMLRLYGEITELAIALRDEDPSRILEEAADVANFAMFIADITRYWPSKKKIKEK